MKSYYTQNNGECETCSLVNYGRDCQNNPIGNVRLTITLPAELHEKLRKEAYDKRTSISKVIISRLGR